MALTPVKCPAQNATYSDEFHKIDKINRAAAPYDLGGASQKHNWSKKLADHYFNVNNENSYKYYVRVCELYTRGRWILDMMGCMQDSAHVFCARVDPRRKRQAEHPPVCRDTTNVFDSGCGQKIRSDAKGIVTQAGYQQTQVLSQIRDLRLL